MDAESRREFLKRLGAGGALVAAARVATREARAAWPFGKAGPDWVSLGKPDAWPEGRWTAVEQATRVADGKLLRRPKLAVWRTGAQVRVLSTRCTHFGSEVAWKDGQFACPSHGGVFDAEGRPTKGPPKRPLPAYETVVGPEGDLRVDLSAPKEPAPAAVAP